MSAGLSGFVGEGEQVSQIGNFDLRVRSGVLKSNNEDVSLRRYLDGKFYTTISS